MKKLSVIMPVYNGEKYVREAIESVICQTYSNLELIIINDGSTDKTDDICKQYIDNPKVKYQYQNNQGAQNARTNALAKAEGEYIAFIDADDYADKRMYEILIEALEKNNADFAACGFSQVSKLELSYNSEMDVICGAENIIKAIYGKARGYLWNKVYKRECLQLTDFDKDINLGEDGLFNLKMARNLSKIVITTSPLYYYRLIPESITHTHTRKYEKWEKEADAYYKLYLKEKNTYLEPYLKMMLANCIIKAAESGINRDDKKDIFRRLRDIQKEIQSIKSLNLPSKSVAQWRMIYYCPALFILSKRILNKTK